jgi:hypothetical protein
MDEDNKAPIVEEIEEAPKKKKKEPVFTTFYIRGRVKNRYYGVTDSGSVVVLSERSSKELGRPSPNATIEVKDNELSYADDMMKRVDDMIPSREEILQTAVLALLGQGFDADTLDKLPRRVYESMFPYRLK